MKKRICNICKIEKDITQFHRRRSRQNGKGRIYRCRKCKAEYQHQYYKKNGEKVNKDRRAEYEKRRNPKKLKANKQVFNAIHEGELDKPIYCEKCKTTDKKIMAHHEDYDFPFKVQWLCQSCHMVLHHGNGSYA